MTALEAFGWGMLGGFTAFAILLFLAWVWPKQDWFD